MYYSLTVSSTLVFVSYVTTLLLLSPMSSTPFWTAQTHSFRRCTSSSPIVHKVFRRWGVAVQFRWSCPELFLEETERDRQRQREERKREREPKEQREKGKEEGLMMNPNPALTKPWSRWMLLLLKKRMVVSTRWWVQGDKNPKFENMWRHSDTTKTRKYATSWWRHDNQTLMTRK